MVLSAGSYPATARIVTGGRYHKNNELSSSSRTPGSTRKRAVRSPQARPRLVSSSDRVPVVYRRTWTLEVDARVIIGHRRD